MGKMYAAVVGWLDSLKDISVIIGCIGVVAASIIGLVILIGKVTPALTGSKLKNTSRLICMCLCMIPFTLAVSEISQVCAKKIVKNEYETLQAEVKAKTMQNELLEQQERALKLSIENENLKKQNDLLKHSQAQITQLQEIAELALLQTDLNQTKVWLEPLSDVQSGWGIKADSYMDNLMLVKTYDMNVKYGIDFTDVRVKKAGTDEIVISKIKPKLIGMNHQNVQSFFNEIVRKNVKGSGSYYTIQSYDDYRIQADTLAQNLENEYFESLSEMGENHMMADAVKKIGENFLKTILGSLFSKITFSDIDDIDAVPILEFLNHEIEENEKNMQ